MESELEPELELELGELMIVLSTASRKFFITDNGGSELESKLESFHLFYKLESEPELE